ncbi:MAG TPA: proteasome subunit alpha [Streptosporangiaceae bacterium]|nr:proteasome subunit alpha [Streptosporangiaceae bacterium]
MPFYVSPEQVMKDKADYARKRIAQIRSGVVIDCEAGILFVAPNPSRALRKFSEMYDRIAFAAVGRYNEFESLRKAGVRYADMTGFQYDRQDVTARGLANWYGQLLGSLFTDSNKPYEVEIVVAEVGTNAGADEIYRITFEGSVADEHGFVVMGGQADKVAAVLKERYATGMSLTAAMTLAIAALGGQGDGANAEPVTASQLEVALLERSRTHRAFRRLTGARLDALLAEAMPKAGTATEETTGTESTEAQQTGPESANAAPGGGADAGGDGAANGGGDSGNRSGG